MGNRETWDLAIGLDGRVSLGSSLLDGNTLDDAVENPPSVTEEGIDAIRGRNGATVMDGNLSGNDRLGVVIGCLGRTKDDLSDAPVCEGEEATTAESLLGADSSLGTGDLAKGSKDFPKAESRLFSDNRALGISKGCIGAIESKVGD